MNRAGIGLNIEWSELRLSDGGRNRMGRYTGKTAIEHVTVRVPVEDERWTADVILPTGAAITVRCNGSTVTAQLGVHTSATVTIPRSSNGDLWPAVLRSADTGSVVVPARFINPDTWTANVWARGGAGIWSNIEGWWLADLIRRLTITPVAPIIHIDTHQRLWAARIAQPSTRKDAA